jgi:hypothetical protein
MTIEEFLKARIDEIERMFSEFPAVLTMCDAMSDIIKWHEQFPVLVELKPEFGIDDRYDTSMNELKYVVNQKMEWMTVRAYRERFGTEPPTAPLLRKWAWYHKDHPDWNKEWDIDND